MLFEEKPRREDQPRRRAEELAAQPPALSLLPFRHRPRLLEATLAALKILRIEAEALHRMLDQMRTGAEERKVMCTEDDPNARLDEPEHASDRDTAGSFEMS